MTTPTPYSDFAALVECAPLDDLRLRHPVGGMKFSPDVMVPSASRPPIGVQGMILDAMDDGRLTLKEASDLLYKVQARLRKEATGGR
jgi:hypothetical protein